MNARADLLLGLVPDMPSADYHAIPALGSSGLRQLARSPRHYFGQYLDPRRPIREPTPAMRAGTLAHCALLEPHAVGDRYIQKSEGLDGRTKDGKAWLASVPPGIECVTAEQWQTAMRQADAIRALPEIAALLESGAAEQSAFWLDEATGVHCKVRPDWVSPAGEGVILVDLKTTQDASPGGFPRSIANYGYHLQEAWYSEGYARASGKPVLGFVFVCVEADFPHAACAFMLDDESRSKARSECRRLLDLYAECSSKDEWPGYPDTIQLLSLPSWAT